MWQMSGNCLHARHPVYGLARATEAEASLARFCFLKMRLKQFEGEFFHFFTHTWAHRKPEGLRSSRAPKNTTTNLLPFAPRRVGYKSDRGKAFLSKLYA